MKKVFLFSLFLTATGFSYAQSLSTIDNTMGTDIMKAKAMIDKFIAKDSSKADAWYYKGKIYNEISKHDSINSACADCKMEAFNAFKKYQVMDSKNIQMALTQNVELFDIYTAYFNLAGAAYGKKDYTGALHYFQKTDTVEGYIKSKDFSYNGFEFPAFDTLLINDLAISARAAGDDSLAVVYYQKITDANISDPQYVSSYEYAADYYSRKKDWADLDPILVKGKKFYPKDPFWESTQTDEIESSATKEEALNKYAEATANSSSYFLNFNYSVYLFNYVFGDAGTPANTKFYKDKLPGQIEKTIGLDSSAEANLLMGRLYYNYAFDLESAADKLKATEIKKQKLLDDSASNAGKEAIIYSEAAIKMYEAMPSLKGIDKDNYLQGLDILRQLYQLEKNPAKVAEYSAKLKSAQ